MVRSSSSSVNSHRKNGKARLSGGPSVPDWVNEWWKSEAARVAEIDSLAEDSVPTLITRIAKAGLDLSMAGIERYSQADRLYKQKTKLKALSS